jgi:peptidoglycan/LPS O-acetylase OafA/YrhL
MIPLQPLTSLRFVAALFVMMLHAVWLGQNPKARQADLEIASAGVTFFFVLSGFILTYNYRNAFRELHRPKLKQFYLARFARIFPLHILAFILVLGATWDGIQLLQGKFGSPFWRAIGNLTLMHGYGPISWRTSFNGPAWSLSTEWTCYLFFPFLMVALQSRRLGLKIGVSCVVLAVWLWAWSRLIQYGSNSYQAGLLITFPPVRLFDFFVGCLLGSYFCHRMQQNPSMLNHSQETSSFWTRVEFGTLGVLILFLMAGGRQSTPMIVALNWNGYYLPIFSAIVWVFAIGRGRVSKWLSRPWMVRLGDASFSLYMLHAVPLAWIGKWNLAPPDGFDHDGYYIGFILLMIGVSLFVHRSFEIPMRDWIRGRRSKVSTPS